MNQQPNRKAIWISTVLTITVMGIASLFLFGPTRLFAVSQSSQMSTVAAQRDVIAPSGQKTEGQSRSSAAAAATSAEDAAVIADYQAQLDQSYQALQDAYAQIQALQTALAQSQGQLRRFNGDGRGRQILPQIGLNRDGGLSHD